MRYLGTLSWAASLVALLATLAACAGAPAARSGKVQAVTTLPLFADFVRNVGGDRVDVTAIVPPGAEPHTYQPTPQDAVAISRADVIFHNGLGLEQAAENMVRNQARRDAVQVTFATGMPVIKDEDSPGGNPHMWLDMRRAMIYVGRVRDALSQVDPSGADIYKANAAAYLDKLDALDGQIETQMKAIPEARRKLVTYHDAFPYFAQRYGLKLVGVVLRNPGSEPSAADMANLARALKENSVQTVYVEPQFDPRLMTLMARDAGAQVRPLYSDALDEKVSTYIDMMRFNARQIVEGLGGQR